MNSLNKEYPAKEIISSLNKIGISKTVFYQVRDQIFNSRRDGHTVLYSFKNTPIYKGILENAGTVSKQQTILSTISTHEIINELKNRGYRGELTQEKKITL